MPGGYIAFIVINVQRNNSNLYILLIIIIWPDLYLTTPVDTNNTTYKTCFN